MRKKVFSILFILCLIFPFALVLTGCGGNGEEDETPASVEFVYATVTIKTNSAYEYNEAQSSFTLPANSNVQEIITKDAFSVTLHFSDGSQTENFTDYTLSFEENEYASLIAADYFVEIKYQNTSVKSYSIYIEKEILANFEGLSYVDPGNHVSPYWLYSNTIEYTGSEIDVLDIISTAEGKTLKSLLSAQNPIITRNVDLIDNEETRATVANLIDGQGNYNYYVFSIYAADGYAWRDAQGNLFDSMTIYWRISPKTVTINAPTLTSSTLTYNGSNQRPEFIFENGTENYFNMNYDSQMNKDAGNYTWSIELKNEYTTANYNITVNNSANFVQDPEQIGYFCLKTNWSIEKYTLSVAAPLITNAESTIEHEGKDYSVFTYNESGISISTNVDNLTGIENIFSKTLWSDGLLSVDIYDYALQLSTGENRKNYLWSDGTEVAETYNLPFEIIKAEGVLPVGLANNINLNDTTYNVEDDTVYAYGGYQQKISTGLFKDDLSNFDLEDKLSWADENTVLNAGNNVVNILYTKNENYNSVALTATIVVEKAAIALSGSYTWSKESLYVPEVYDGSSKTNCTIEISDTYDDKISSTINYVTYYKAVGAANFGSTPVETFINAGTYKTIATITCTNSNFYLFTADNQNTNHQNVVTTAYEWIIDQSTISPSEVNINAWGSLEGDATHDYNDGNGNDYFGAYYSGSNITLDYKSEINDGLDADVRFIKNENHPHGYSQHYYKWNAGNSTWVETLTTSEVGIYKAVMKFYIGSNYKFDFNQDEMVFEFEVFADNYDLSTLAFGSQRTFEYSGSTLSSSPLVQVPAGLKVVYSYYDKDGNPLADWETTNPGTYKVSAVITAVDTLSNYSGVELTNGTSSTQKEIAQVEYEVIKQKINVSNFTLNEDAFNNTLSSLIEISNKYNYMAYLFDIDIDLRDSSNVKIEDVYNTILNPLEEYSITITITINDYSSDLYELTNANNLVVEEISFEHSWTVSQYELTIYGNFEWIFDHDNKFTSLPTKENIHVFNLPTSVTNWQDIIDVEFEYRVYNGETMTYDLIEAGTPLESGKNYTVMATILVKDEFKSMYTIDENYRYLTNDWFIE